MLKDLIKIANSLDKKGLQREANYLDTLIKKIAQQQFAPGTGIRLDKGDPYEYFLSDDGTYFRARNVKDNGPLLPPNRNAKILARLKGASGSASSGWKLPSLPSLSRKDTNPDPKFREGWEKDVELRDEDSFLKRDVGELGIVATLKAISLIFKGIAATWPGSWPMQFFWEFMALRSSPLEITGSDMQNAAYYVCLSAKRRGSSTVGYVDYKKGQELDPNRSSVVSTFQQGDSLGSVFSSDPYKALSACFGNAEYQGDAQSGFTITDSFNFNLDRDPTIIEKAENYVANMENLVKMVNRIRGGKVGAGKVGLIEEVLVMYEHTMRYTGFATFVRAPKPSKGILTQVKDKASELYESLPSLPWS